MKKLLALISIIGVLGLLGLACIGIFFWKVESVIHEPILKDSQTKEVFYEVQKKTSLQKITDDLASLQILTHPKLFYWYLRITRESKNIKAGDYRFTDKMTLQEVVKIIQSGVSYSIPVTIPEGYNIYQIAEALNHLRSNFGAEFLEVAKDAHVIQKLGLPSKAVSLEGYLFPDTYGVTRKMTALELAQQMVKRFWNVCTPEYIEKARELGFSLHEIVTLASIVEKETGAGSERPKIASVFHNRLKKKMKLQSDPTVVYEVAGYNGNITRKHLDTWTPYNTYQIPALPKGPISNPGREALDATLYPETTPYLYFVSHNDGTHEFTETYDAHLNAVKKFQLDPSAREGKSWRNLSKKDQKKKR